MKLSENERVSIPYSGLIYFPTLCLTLFQVKLKYKFNTEQNLVGGNKLIKTVNGNMPLIGVTSSKKNTFVT